ncbi:MAG: type II toxin-antitoxin system RelE/ParE family toxin [Metallibacterium scheffleri]|jgi:addiction module RelE/StbE family toxin|uniref:type II toxin-antitoxin system RelE/ParE family toxin n=1 Tax=Metallibacterium scheffleri TaxID=993689 RepID=UPI0026EA9F2D|nr:type II toxin-antitoxin system RelE/ParE family toxin [Metallibacterium scheffleri]MCK9367492.1 type II toxin-antitoxin system RelE/ParE family toxin [Metallibacterium scheffleri]
MLPLRWSAKALDELDAIAAYIALFNPAAAEELQALIEASVLPLSEHPYLYRAGRVAGTRELVVHPNYIVIYRVLADPIEIIGVLHAHREYP